MKKILTIAFVAIALAFAGCSGGDDDTNIEGGNNNGNVENNGDNGNNDKDDDDEDVMPQLMIFGSWEMYKSVWHDFDSDAEYSFPVGEEYGMRVLLRFWEDGRGVEIEMEPDDNEWHESEYEFTFSQEGDRLYVQYSEPYDPTPEIYQIVKLTPEDLILKDSGAVDEVTNFYKRIGL